jgi:cytochrome c biogenesis protein CcmG, thiol:disulfide interchange protein DsbE
LGASSLLRVGKPAPEFSLKTLDGAGTVSLGQLRGKRVLINFWASWCTPCIEETPALIEAYRNLNDPTVAFVAIGMQDDLANLKKFAVDYGVPYLVVSDADGAVGDAYAVRGLPTTILIDSSGVVQNIVSGPVQRDKVVDLIGRLQ